MQAISGNQLYSSRTSEEGFHSGSSTDESPSFNADRLSYEMSTMTVSQKRYTFGQHKCNSDSGASTGELEQQGMKDDVAAAVVRPKQPGAWFFEENVSLFRGDSESPTSENDEMYLAQLMNARNVSENVEVPSSEHVAEIVGRQGCKIKALRAKTNTYIKTPVRGEEPVFVVTGKPEDVVEAKREIECAAEHFTQIRASRRHSQGGAPAPGHVTAYVRVPLRVVGLVVGPKGATIKRIQQDTHTYIITPSREREPIFEVTGLPQNVEAARKEIEQHIYQRTGNMPITDPSASLSHYAQQPTAVVGDYHMPSQVSSLSAAASATARAAYGSLAQPRRVAQYGESFGPFAEMGHQQNIQQHQQHQSAIGFNNLMRSGGYSSKPFGVSSVPNVFAQQQPVSTPFQPWSTNAFVGGVDQHHHQQQPQQMQQQHDMFYPQRPSNMLSGASAWSSAFPLACQPGGDQRDEGLGDSPASGMGMENPYRLMSSIWSDIDENKQAPQPLLTA